MKVSIVTPSYNQGQFIARTLQSVRVQRETLDPSIELEHVVFDGASNDTTLEILKNSANLTWFSEPDNGQTHAVNKGILHTTGEIIGWLNSDDIYYPDAIAQIVKFFADNPDVDIVYGMAKHIDHLDNIINSYPTRAFKFTTLIENCFICQPAVFFRRRILGKSGLLDQSLNYCMDYEFWIRLARMGFKFAYLEKTIAGSRLYPENKTLSAKVAVHKEINDMLKSHLNYVPKLPIINYAYAVVSDELDKNATPYRFAYRILKESLNAAKYWNNGTMRFLQQASGHWLKALLTGRFAQWYKVS